MLISYLSHDTSTSFFLLSFKSMGSIMVAIFSFTSAERNNFVREFGLLDLTILSLFPYSAFTLSFAHDIRKGMWPVSVLLLQSRKLSRRAHPNWPNLCKCGT